MMTAADFAEEIAFYLIKPWGDEWERTSLQASQFYNANKGKNSPTVEYDHFIPKSKQQKTEDLVKKLQGFFGQRLERNGQ